MHFKNGGIAHVRLLKPQVPFRCGFNHAFETAGLPIRQSGRLIPITLTHRGFPPLFKVSRNESLAPQNRSQVLDAEEREQNRIVLPGYNIRATRFGGAVALPPGTHFAGEPLKKGNSG